MCSQSSAHAYTHPETRSRMRQLARQLWRVSATPAPGQGMPAPPAQLSVKDLTRPHTGTQPCSLTCITQGHTALHVLSCCLRRQQSHLGTGSSPSCWSSPTTALGKQRNTAQLSGLLGPGGRPALSRPSRSVTVVMGNESVDATSVSRPNSGSRINQ